MKFKMLGSLRSKEEIINYFEENGKNISEEEIEALREYYKQVKSNAKYLDYKQLNKVVGGVVRPRYQFNCRFITSEALRNDQPTSLYFRPRDIRCHRYTILNSPEFENFSNANDPERIVYNFVEDYYTNHLRQNDDSDLARAVRYFYHYFHSRRQEII